MGLNVDGSPRKTVLSEGASLRGQRRGVSGIPEWQRPRGAVWPPVPGRAEAIRPGEPFLTAGQHRELRSLVGFAQRASSVVVGSGSGELRPRSPGPWKATRAAASGGRRAAGRGGASARRLRAQRCAGSRRLLASLTLSLPVAERAAGSRRGQRQTPAWRTRPAAGSSTFRSREAGLAVRAGECADAAAIYRTRPASPASETERDVRFVFCRVPWWTSRRARSSHRPVRISGA